MGIGARIKCFKNEIKLTLNLPKIFKEIHNVLKEKQLWEGLKRKSRFRRFFENIWWYFRHGEACIYYNSYGFDIKKFRNKKTYLPYRRFRIERFYEDYPKNLFDNKLCILRDKILFSAFFGEILGKKYVIDSVALINPDGTIFDFISKENVNYQVFFKERRTDYFIKKINGECGEGCYLMKLDQKPETIMGQIKGSQFLVQRRIEQHKDIDEINPSCINTIRIITIIGKKSRKPDVFAHYMRIGCNSINDNRATGGVGVGIDENGTMLKYGVGHHRIETAHSITGHNYEGTKIPFWSEVKELVVKAHSALTNIPTIGWDVALTPDGPVLIEGNDNWEISGAQDALGGLKREWYEYHKR